jgi:hypothetical protein
MIMLPDTAAILSNASRFRIEAAFFLCDASFERM